MGWMTKVKPEEKTSGGIVMATSSTVPAYTVHSVGDMKNGLILLGPLYNDFGQMLQPSLLWADPATILISARKNGRTHIAFLGKVFPHPTSYQNSSFGGWIDDKVLALCPSGVSISTPSGIPITP